MDTNITTFPCAFTNITYSIVATVCCDDKPNNIKLVCVQGPTVSGITFYMSDYYRSRWVAVGY